eukprot:Phypoly_transcript_01115.p1 GENE.Phypoly_transcript_01115~~Phypoly_transcript_01115.p1  ORF type:complete len:1206 (+),score=167.17 Phypoly_transcript_01115:25-3618(+)
MEDHPFFNHVIEVVCHGLKNTVQKEFVFLEEEGRIDVVRVERLFGGNLLITDENGNLKAPIEESKIKCAATKANTSNVSFFSELTFQPGETLHVSLGIHNELIHLDVVCDKCDKKVIGTRYKCASCGDFDLCSYCYDLHLTGFDKHYHSDFYIYNRRKWRPSQLISSYHVDTFRQAFANFSQQPCLSYKVNDNSRYYTWLTYKEVQEFIVHFGSGLVPYLAPRDFVGICAKNSIEWVFADMACIWYSFVCVPIHFALDHESMQHIITHSGVACMVTSRDYTFKILSMDIPKVKLIVQTDPLHDEEISLAQEKGKKLVYFYAVVAQGEAKILPPKRTKLNEISTIYYTSGSTGRPKGVVVNDRCANGDLTYAPDNLPHVQLEYLPFGHAMGRDSIKRSFFLGGKMALFTRDMEYLFDETRVVQPTRFRGVPAVWHTLYEIYLRNLARARQGQPPQDPLDDKIEQEERRNIRAMFGIYIISVVTGSAATSPAVIDFIQKTFSNCAYHEGYGTTEASGIASNGRLILEGLSYKILDCPDLGYFQSDKPFPRGELAIKTEFMASGYYNDDEANKEAYTEDGHFKTGDVVELDGTSIRIIDRKKNFFKLSNGEFIRSQYLESIFEDSGIIDQIFVTGAPFSKYVVAVVVPNLKSIHELNKEQSDIDIQQLILNELQTIAAEKKLANFEIPKIVHIESEPFTIENLLQTPSFKKNRPNLTKKYTDIVLNLTRTVELKELLQDEFGAGQISEKDNVMDSIGDSMSKVRFMYKIKEKFAKEVPVNYVYDKHTLSELVSYLNTAKAKTKTEYEEFMEDYKNWRSLVEFSPEPPNLTMDSGEASRKLFLTGATGFLGGFLLSELLQTTDYHIWCLVRATDEGDGLAKIRRNMENMGILEENLMSKIKVVIGDLSLHKLGLSDERFVELCTNVDVIIHNGAIVNWQIPYKEQRLPNVFGTKWILEIAKTYKIKPLVYVSTFSTRSMYGTSYDIENVESLARQEGYVLSKWLAEFCVRQQLESNHPVAIVRPGMITGHSISGACNHSQFVSRYLRGVFEMGGAIDSDGYMTDLNPVDCVSKTIARILRSLEDKHAQKNADFQIETSVYNLADLMVATYNDAWEVCHALNPEICKLPYGTWRRIVSDEKNVHLYPLLPYFPADKTFSASAPRGITQEDLPEIKLYGAELQKFSPQNLLQNQISHMHWEKK